MVLDSLKRFFMGKIYPFFVVVLMFVSYVTSTEVYVNVINLFLLSLALLVCDSIRPLIAVLPAYLYQFSAKTAMPTPEGLKFLLSGRNLMLYIVSFSALAFALVIFFVKNRLLTKDKIKALPHPIVTVFLSAAFLLNGFLSETASFASFMYGVVQIVTFFGIFYIFFLGIENEDLGELMLHFAYVTALLSILIFADIAFFYATNFDAIVVNGKIVREELVFGWGISNTAGQLAAVLIPMCFFGVMKSSRPLFYTFSASLAFLSIFLSTSRNAILTGGVILICCIILASFIGEMRKKFRALLLICITVVAALLYFFKDLSAPIIDSFISRSSSMEERLRLWEYAFEEFKDSPVFGKGFYGLWTDFYSVDWGFPTMMHNTVLQILASMGLVGLAAYLLYRLRTLIPFVIKPTLEKTMLGMSLLVVVVGSLFDNFLFYIPHMLYYPIAMAIAFKIYREQIGFGQI